MNHLYLYKSMIFLLFIYSFINFYNQPYPPSNLPFYDFFLFLHGEENINYNYNGTNLWGFLLYISFLLNIVLLFFKGEKTVASQLLKEFNELNSSRESYKQWNDNEFVNSFFNEAKQYILECKRTQSTYFNFPYLIYMSSLTLISMFIAILIINKAIKVSNYNSLSLYTNFEYGDVSNRVQHLLDFKSFFHTILLASFIFGMFITFLNYMLGIMRARKVASEEVENTISKKNSKIKNIIMSKTLETEKLIDENLNKLQRFQINRYPFSTIIDSYLASFNIYLSKVSLKRKIRKSIDKKKRVYTRESTNGYIKLTSILPTFVIITLLVGATGVTREDTKNCLMSNSLFNKVDILCSNAGHSQTCELSTYFIAAIDRPSSFNDSGGTIITPQGAGNLISAIGGFTGGVTEESDTTNIGTDYNINSTSSLQNNPDHLLNQIDLQELETKILVLESFKDDISNWVEIFLVMIVTVLSLNVGVSVWQVGNIARKEVENYTKQFDDDYNRMIQNTNAAIDKKVAELKERIKEIETKIEEKEKGFQEIFNRIKEEERLFTAQKTDALNELESYTNSLIEKSINEIDICYNERIKEKELN